MAPEPQPYTPESLKGERTHLQVRGSPVSDAVVGSSMPYLHVAARQLMPGQGCLRRGQRAQVAHLTLTERS